MARVLPKRAEAVEVVATGTLQTRSVNIASPAPVNFSPNNTGCIVARLWRFELFIG